MMIEGHLHSEYKMPVRPNRFRRYRRSIEWLAREFENDSRSVNEMAKDRAVRLVAKLSALPPTAVAGDVWRMAQEKERALQAARQATIALGAVPTVVRVATMLNMDWTKTRLALEALQEQGAVKLQRRGRGPIYVIVKEEEKEHG